MKSKNIFISLILFGVLLNPNIQAQSNQEIIIKKSIFSRFYHYNQRIDGRDLGDVLKSNPKSYKVYKASITPKISSHFLGFSGGFFLGRGLYYNAINRVNKHNDSIYLGFGLGSLGIIMRSYSNRIRIAAIEEYNLGLKNGIGSNEKMYLHYTGQGLCLTF